MKRPVDVVRKDGTNTTIRYGMRKNRDVNYLVAMDFPFLSLLKHKCI
jgi:hypothetical protein